MFNNNNEEVPNEHVLDRCYDKKIAQGFVESDKETSTTKCYGDGKWSSNVLIQEKV